MNLKTRIFLSTKGKLWNNLKVWICKIGSKQLQFQWNISNGLQD